MGDPGTGTVPDLEADVVDVAAAETVRTAEAEVGVGEMVHPRTPPPTKTDRKIEAVRTDRKEVGRSRNRNLWGWDPLCGQPSGAHKRS